VTASKQKVLITGGAGYLGSTLVPRLLEHGHRVVVLDDFRYGETSLLACVSDERFEAVRGDARDERVVRRLMRDADVIIPLAAIVGAPACERASFAAISTNTDAVVMLDKVRSRGQRILFPTTNSGYGRTAGVALCTEESPLKPISLYGRTKVEAEQALLDSGGAVTFRLATVFGVSPRLRLDLLVNDFTWRAYRDRTLVLYEAEFVRNFVAVRDVAALFTWAIEREPALPDGPYNFGLSDANYSKRELCQIIQRAVPAFAWIESAVGTDPDQRNYRVSNAKVEAAGFPATIPVDQGIAELLKAFTMISPLRYGNA
jgi:nucleoside-diphosphate-sugar epimerase